ncbi:expressed unknown protein [Seminavis robusta]|uniref:Uncharacterized protein n=1 Tax=Seminavis robusta TaxID=568900 RepID=A0A9N8DKT6_9STRA|nr:expressed unknown protein [Seminavis robusta]|eukprot:Sro135_g063690.1 n/a (516) ;mRNA; f:22923-24655
MLELHRLLQSQFDQCSENCGWIAAFVAALSYGTFGVPIKQTVSVDVHPLVLQSYKTITMFLFSWFIIYLGESIRFTPWGLLSGLLWVCGGTGGIFAIRNAGMSVAVGTWSSCMVVINFLVGIVFFQEPVASIPSTFGAFCFLAVGLVGMSIYSAPTTQQQQQSATSSEDRNIPLMDNNNPAGDMLLEEDVDSDDERPDQQEMTPITITQGITSRLRCISPARNRTTSNSAMVGAEVPVGRRLSPCRSRSSEGLDDAINNATNTIGAPAYDPLRDPSREPDDNDDPIGGRRRCSENDKKDRRFLGFFREAATISIFNTNGLTRRQLGILGAVINGVLTGSSLVPIHYAKKQGFGGAAYMLSFASGALLANITIWIIWFLAEFIRTSSSHHQQQQQRDATGRGSIVISSCTATFESMPPVHFRQLWAPGFAAGTLLSIAMFGSILSVTYLGQGVGNSIIQSKILISGLWGIFWYREIVGGVNIAKWFASAAVAVTSILWLSYERIHSKAAVSVDAHF